ncbi:hypothetical protein [Jannaschia marina]|uniref:hypothetical protein n=1 Tax=Jannaschia marina TaxID=2741674 RepID=UPI0015CBD361|nr:hypothetical protein [Jannaschia marina]
MSGISGLGPIFGSPSQPPADGGNGDTGETDETQDGTGGAGETGGTGETSGTGGAGNGGTSGDETGSESAATARADAAEAAPDEPASTGFTLDGVISESQRLDLAFARVLDAALARRYAEAARLELISDGLLQRLEDAGGRASEFSLAIAELREEPEAERDRAVDRRA